MTDEKKSEKKDSAREPEKDKPELTKERARRFVSLPEDDDFTIS